MSSTPRILIIRLSSLGDILHTLPAFSDLKGTFPNAEIDWLVSKKCWTLLSAVPGIKRIHVVDTDSLLRAHGIARAWKEFRALIETLKEREYELAIDFQGLLKTGFLTRLSGPRIRVGFSKGLVRERPTQWFYHRVLTKPPGPVHVIELNRRLAGLAGAKRTEFRTILDVSDTDSRYIDELLIREDLDDFIIINPGGGWPTKRWRPERYGLLAKRLQAETGLPIVVTTGPGEELLYSAIAEASMPLAPRHLTVSFLQMIPLLKRARVFIGGDTGPFHLACAVGTPVVGIFGPTSPVRNGPWDPGERTVVHQLPCSFCYGRSCPTKNECMDIAVEEVLAASLRQLGKNDGETNTSA